MNRFIASPGLQVARRMQEKLGLQDSNNTFALYKQNSVWEQPVCGSALIADVLYRLVVSASPVSHSAWKTEQTPPHPHPPPLKRSDTINS